MSRDDVESGLQDSQAGSGPGRAESHQAEASPLAWSDAQHKWTIAPSQLPKSKAEEAPSDASSHATAVLAEPNHPIYVEFDVGDQDNPFEWPRRRKWIITLIGSWLTLLVAIAGPGFVSGTQDMMQDLGFSHIAISLAFSIYALGFGLGPLVLAPISEVYGRNTMYRASMVLFTLFYLPLALGSDLALICVFRFLSGVAGSVGSTMVGGTIADIWNAKERGRPMAVFSIGAFAGTGFGPAMFGYVAQYAGWRWIEWIQMIMAGATAVIVLVCFRETRGSVILSRRAAKLRKETGLDYRCRADEERATLLILIKTGVSRPIWFFFTEPIVLSLSIWVGFAWGALYGLVEAVGLVYQNVYGWSLGASGLAFLAVALGGFVGYFGNIFQERAYKRYQPTKGIEARLYGSLYGGLMFACGSMIFAWAIKGHWFGPLVGLTITISGIYYIYQGVFLYLADAYTIYASSAMSAQSFVRNFMGFIFPLFVTQMYNNLGYSWAAFLIAMVGFVLAVIPFILWRYGATLRANSPAAIQLAHQLAELEQKHAEKLAAAGLSGGRRTPVSQPKA